MHTNSAFLQCNRAENSFFSRGCGCVFIVICGFENFFAVRREFCSSTNPGFFLTLTFHSKFHQKSFSLFRLFQKFLFFLFHRKTDNRDRELWRKNLSFFLLNNPFCFFCPRRVLSWPFVFKQLLKLNWMFYVLSPTFQQHNTKFSFMPAFPAYALAHTRRTRKNGTNTASREKLFPIPSCQKANQHRRMTEASKDERRIFCQTCEFSRTRVAFIRHKPKCAPAEIFNALWLSKANI